MVSIFKKLSVYGDGLDITQADQGNRVQVATCAILMAVAGADEFTDDEKKRIVHILKDEFSLADDDVQALMEIAKREIDRSIDYWGFTNTLNKNLSETERTKIMEGIWKVIYTDGRLSAHEDTIAHKFSYLLDLRHDQMIASKLKAKHEMGLDRKNID